MFRVRFCTLIVFVLLASSLAEARELALRLENRLGGDSNVFRRTQESTIDEVADGFLSIVPTIRVRERQKELRYELFYRPIFQTFFDNSGVGGWDQFQRANADWSINDRNSIGISQSYSRSRRLRQDTEITDVPGEFVLEENDRQKITRTAASAYFSRQWAARVNSSLGGSFDDVQFSDAFNRDSRAYSGNLSIDYVPVQRWTLGIAGLGRFRETDSLQTIPGESAWIANIGVTIAHKLTPSIDLSVQAGPTLIWTKREGFERVQDSSFFANASLRKTLERGLISLSYSRSESASAGAGSSIVDSARFAINFSPLKKLAVSAAIDFSNREAISSLEAFSGLGQDDVVRAWTAIGTVAYDVTKNWRVSGDLRFRNGEVTRQVFTGFGFATTRNETRIVSGFVSLEYIFDAWVF